MSPSHIAPVVFAVTNAIKAARGAPAQAVPLEAMPEAYRKGLDGAIAARLANPLLTLSELTPLPPDASDAQKDLHALQDAAFCAVVDSLKSLPDPAPVVADGKPVSTHLPVKYIGRRETYREAAYGTGLVFLQGQTQLVRADVAKKMLQHPDVYVLGEAAAAAPVTESQDPAAQKAQEEALELQRRQEARDSINAMRSKDAVRKFIETTLGQKVPEDIPDKLEPLKSFATMRVDQFGVPA